MSLPRTAQRTITLTAARQHGLITRRQAAAAGMSPAMIHHRQTVGVWSRAGSGVYRLAGAPVTWRQKALAACLVSGDGAVLSHQSAAALYGVVGFRPGPLHVTVPSGRSARNVLATVHRSKLLRPRDRAIVDRIPVTKPAQVLVDLAGRVPAGALTDAVDDILCRRVASLDTLMRLSNRIGPHRNVATLNQILAAWRGESRDVQLAEMRLVRRLAGHGLPAPVRQFPVQVPGGTVWRIDLAYPDHKVGIEMDSFRWHAGVRPFREDRRRRNRLTALGWTLLHATVDDTLGGRELVDALVTVLCSAA